MTSPEESIGQARVFACACAKKKKPEWRKNGSLHLQRLNSTKAAQRRADTGPPPLTLQLSKTCHCRPRMHSLILEEQAAVAPNLFNLCSAPAPSLPTLTLQRPHSSWRTKPLSDPHISLAQRQAWHGPALLPRHFFGRLVCFGKKKRWWMPKTNFSFLLLLVNSSLCLPTRRSKGTPGCLLHVNSLVLLYALHRCLDWFRFIPSKQLLISTLSLYAIWKHAETYL